MQSLRSLDVHAVIRERVPCKALFLILLQHTTVLLGGLTRCKSEQFFLDRKKFDKALGLVLEDEESFAYHEVHAFPEDMDMWKERARKILDTYNSLGKVAQQRLHDVLQHMNGDLTSSSVQHWCCMLPCGDRCCPDRAAALSCCKRVLSKFFASGFQKPLLYRFKHFEEAATYVRLGYAVHAVLPRVLQRLQAMTDSVPEPAPDQAVLADIDDVPFRTTLLRRPPQPKSASLF